MKYLLPNCGYVFASEAQPCIPLCLLQAFAEDPSSDISNEIETSGEVRKLIRQHRELGKGKGSSSSSKSGKGKGKGGSSSKSGKGKGGSKSKSGKGKGSVHMISFQPALPR
jgi:hypothetical protein